MADAKPHATLTPNSAKPGDTLTVAFDSEDASFRNAGDVLIRIFEVDDASPLEPAGKDALLVELAGKLDDNVFTATAAPKLPSAKGNEQKIKIQAGNTTVDVPLLGADGEQGTFELRMTVSWKKPKTAQLVQPREATVFVRAFNHPLPVITFVTSAESTAFFEGSFKFWKKHSDAILRRQGMSLQEVLEVLRDEGDKFGPWGQVNIVSHGNPFQLLMKLHRGSPAALMHEDLIDAELRKLRASQPDAIPVPDSVTSDTEVVFRACNAGQTSAFVQKIKDELFANAKVVRMPKWVQDYESTGAFEALTEELRVIRPTIDAAKAEVPKGLEPDYDRTRLFSPGLQPSAKFEDELPSFGEQHINLINFDAAVEFLEADVTAPNLSPKSNADLVALLRSSWVPLLKFDATTATQKTTDAEWSIEIKSKTDVSAHPRVLARGVWCESGAGTPGFVQSQGGTIVLTTDPGSDVMQLSGTGLSGDIAQLTIDPADFSRVEVQHLAAGGATRVSGGGANTTLTPDHDTATVSLPAQLTIGAAVVKLRLGKVLELSVHASRAYLSQRRQMRDFKSGTPHAQRVRTLIKEDDPNQFHSAR